LIAATMAIGIVSARGMAAEQRLAGIGEAMQSMVDAHEIAGAVTLVVDRDGVLHEEGVGLADVSSSRPMTTDAMFWIASMTKPITGAAVMILVDEGRIALDDPVERHLPEFAALKMPSGRPI